jgi:hypothetical protein
MSERDDERRAQQAAAVGTEPPHGGENEADAKRPGGPRYHGADWKRAAEEAQPGGEAEPGAPRADDPVRVDPGQVPGTGEKAGRDR